MANMGFHVFCGRETFSLFLFFLRQENREYADCSEPLRNSHRKNVRVDARFKHGFHWIGLKEKLQETVVLTCFNQ